MEGGSNGGVSHPTNKVTNKTGQTNEAYHAFMGNMKKFKPDLKKQSKLPRVGDIDDFEVPYASPIAQ